MCGPTIAGRIFKLLLFSEEVGVAPGGRPTHPPGGPDSPGSFSFYSADRKTVALDYYKKLIKLGRSLLRNLVGMHDFWPDICRQFCRLHPIFGWI